MIGATGARPGKHYRIDASTGVATEIGSHGGGYYARGDLDWTAAGELLETVTEDDGGDWLARIDPATGDATVIGPTATFDGFVIVGAVAYGTSDDGSLSSIDTSTGSILATRATGHVWTGASPTL